MALDATIEAARAGGAGKGFAVVASEVKIFAAQTMRVADQLAKQINTIQDETERAVEASRSVANTVSAVGAIMAQVAAVTEEQAAATREIGRAVNEAAQGTLEVTRNAEGVTSGATQTDAAATKVRSASAELASHWEQLNAEVVDFLRGIRAALKQEAAGQARRDAGQQEASLVLLLVMGAAATMPAAMDTVAAWPVHRLTVSCARRPTVHLPLKLLARLCC